MGWGDPPRSRCCPTSCWRCCAMAWVRGSAAPAVDPATIVLAPSRRIDPGASRRSSDPSTCARTARRGWPTRAGARPSICCACGRRRHRCARPRRLPASSTTRCSRCCESVPGAAHRGGPVRRRQLGGRRPGARARTASRACSPSTPRRLDALVELDEVSRLATLEPGLRGPQAEALLGERGYTLGHFPQSFQYASLGGFAAARSSGQASAGYGRFDELVMGLRAATPGGDADARPRPALGRRPRPAPARCSAAREHSASSPR